MTAGPNSEPIQSTGDELENIGVIVIDNKTKAIESNKLIPTAEIEGNKEIEEKANEIINDVKDKYAEVFAKTEYILDGSRYPGNRNMETNLGDLISDSMIYSILKKNGNGLNVPTDNIIALEHGGGIRATINVGDITKNDIFSVLPFGNTICVIYVSGATLLSVLETSTQSTPNEMASFPHISGMNITIDTTKEYDKKAEPYPNTQVYGCNSINRVSINSINGKKFDKDATYAVITNDFLAAGGDTYYELAESAIKIDTGIPLDEATMEYINVVLNGVVGKEYSVPQKRVTVLTEDNHIDVTMLDAPTKAITAGSKATIQFRSNADINDFVEFRINGVAIDPSNYTLKAGSTIVTLTEEYVSSLPVGIYDAEIVSATGVAAAQFEIIASEDDLDSSDNLDNQEIDGATSLTSPNTGATFVGAYSIVCGAGLLYFALKKKENK